jgi:hypothetical protein
VAFLRFEVVPTTGRALPAGFPELIWPAASAPPLMDATSANATIIGLYRDALGMRYPGPEAISNQRTPTQPRNVVSARSPLDHQGCSFDKHPQTPPGAPIATPHTSVSRLSPAHSKRRWTPTDWPAVRPAARPQGPGALSGRRERARSVSQLGHTNDRWRRNLSP